MDLVKQAQIIATQKHVLDNHQLYGWLPYTHHLQAVAKVLHDFGYREQTIQAAAWLHDIIEDTRGRPNQMKRRDIEEMFGEEVAKLVYAVTSEEGDNRKIRNALTYPKIRETGELAVALKLADRIANVSHGGGAYSMYKKEHSDFRHGIYVADIRELQDMQTKLDELLDYK